VGAAGPTGGGYSVSSNGSGFMFIYSYPLLGPTLCPGTVTGTAAECCNDASLVTVGHFTFWLSGLNGSSVAAQISAIQNDQIAAGLLQGGLQ